MRRAVIAFWLLSVLAPPLAADQKDPRLPGLFAALAAAPSPELAQPVELRIWEIWFEHGDPVILKLMENAVLAMAVDDFATAERALNQVVVLAPDYAEGWNRRATLYFLTGRIDASLADIATVLALEPRHFGALSGQGLCHLAKDQLPEAAAAFEEALAVNPQMQGARSNLDALKDLLGDDI
jgi:tetratricopeptide (TPR) repeat protein